MGGGCSCQQRETESETTHLWFGGLSRRGKRKTNEDRWNVYPHLPPPPSRLCTSPLSPSAFVVCDGHRGVRAARFAVSRLAQHAADALHAGPSWVRNALLGRTSPLPPRLAPWITAAMGDVFAHIDSQWLERALRAYPTMSDGATATLVLVTPATLIVASVGDSQAVVGYRHPSSGNDRDDDDGHDGHDDEYEEDDDDEYDDDDDDYEDDYEEEEEENTDEYSSYSADTLPGPPPLPTTEYEGGKVRVLSPMHKLRDPRERVRVLAAGAVLSGPYIGAEGTERMIAVSRALGDIELKVPEDAEPKDQVISSVPFVDVLPLTGDETFVVIASDGVWDKLSPTQVANIVHTGIEADTQPRTIALTIINAAIDAGTSDNVTAVVILFQH